MSDAAPAPAPHSGLVYARGPVIAEVCAFGPSQDQPYAALLTFSGADPVAFPYALRTALLGHKERGDSVLVLTRTQVQQSYVRAQIVLMQAPGGRA